MKNALKVVALTLCLVMMVSVLAACGDVSGEYSSTLLGVTTTYDFSTFGNKVTRTTTVGDTVTTNEGSYEINEAGDKITFTFGDDEESYPFEQGEDYIKILYVQYDKQ